MHTKIHILPPIDYRTFRAGLATDKSQFNWTDSLQHFFPLIQNFEKLAVGPYFWFILDFPEEKHCGAGGYVEYLTPFTQQEFSSLNQLKLFKATHPDDLYKVMAFSRYWIEMHGICGNYAKVEFKMSLFFRMLNALGKYYWIMVQYPDGIYNKKNQMIFGLVLVTDISHIKNQGEPMMNIFSQKEKLCQQFYCLNEHTLSETQITSAQLTLREKEILHLLAKGYSSKQIASTLHVSTKTVDNHRQNMLHKTGSKSSCELVSMSIRLGMV